MKTATLDYYNRFKCIADKCGDSCCIGWEIDIDEESLKRYLGESGKLGEDLRKNISESSFILDKKERCPFLYENGLCRLICEKGEDYLCEICSNHPRYYEYYDDFCDKGAGICCEEACRLLFEDESPRRIITEGEASFFEPETEELLELRQKLIQKVTDRTLPLSKRLALPIEYNEIFDIWQEFEPYDQRWSITQAYIKENLEQLLSYSESFLCHIGKRVYEYEHLCVYLLHRYFMRTLYYRTPAELLYGIGVYLGTQYLFDLYSFMKKGRFNFDDRTDTAKYISKQIEYSEENAALLF